MSRLPSTVSLAGLGVSRADQLARLNEAGLVKQGRVFLLSLDPIRIELGARWSGRGDLVWETLERTLTRRMPAPDVFIRIDDATVLAAIASVDAYEGQVRCAECLRSTLAFFLGRSADSDVSIARVSDVGEGQISAEPIDLLAPAPRPMWAGEQEAASTPPERWTPPLAGRTFSGSFLSKRRGAVRISFEIVPVWRRDQDIVGAFMIRRDLPAHLSAFDDYDREMMDHQLVDHLLPLLEEYRREGGVFALIIPGSFSSASARRPRIDLLSRCEPVLDVMRQAVVMQIDGFGPGIPTGRISEMAAMMKPFFHVLTASVADAAAADTVIRDYAFNGMAIDARGMSEERLEMLIRTARRRTRNLVVHDLKPGADTDRLRLLGVSHVSYRPSQPAAVIPDPSASETPVPARVSPEPALAAGG